MSGLLVLVLICFIVYLAAKSSGSDDGSAVAVKKYSLHREAENALDSDEPPIEGIYGEYYHGLSMTKIGRDD